MATIVPMPSFDDLLPNATTHNTAVALAKKSVTEMTDFEIDHTPAEENVTFLINTTSGEPWSTSVRVIAVADSFSLTDTDLDTEGIFALVLNPEGTNPRICLLTGDNMWVLKHHFEDILVEAAPTVNLPVEDEVLEYLKNWEATPERWSKLIFTDRDEV
ncbi:hypothetical protein FYZ39_01290 [Mobiluncus curtisii]|uniref:hypothetical protein n=2 Tax=Mobiluncus curtisii TaxID=2051 RepID=UPI0021E1DCD5|nr:hypothetical protein [Mobiluncus curtisii]MCV0020105.1 hypothetical protein [Mobiluncus curtisii]